MTSDSTANENSQELGSVQKSKELLFDYDAAKKALSASASSRSIRKGLVGVCGSAASAFLLFFSPSITWVITLLVFLSLSFGFFKPNEKSMAQRFAVYLKCLWPACEARVEYLARVSGRKENYVRSDLEWMMKKGWFREACFNNDRSIFFASAMQYWDYLARHSQEPGPAPSQAHISYKEIKDDLFGENSESRTETRQKTELELIIEKGRYYVAEIIKANDTIPGEQISQKISRTEQLVDLIFDRVEEHPENSDDTRKLLDYYLPTLLTLLERYQEIDSQGFSTNDLEKDKRSIENTIDMLNNAFENLLEKMLSSTSMDINAEIYALQTILKQDGLV